MAARSSETLATGGGVWESLACIAPSSLILRPVVSGCLGLPEFSIHGG